MHKETGGIKLALLIPAYNEEKYIEGVSLRIMKKNI